MKALFFLLLLLNLGFIAWQLVGEKPEFSTAPPAASDAQGKRLILLREIDAEIAKLETPESPILDAPIPADENPAPSP